MKIDFNKQINYTSSLKKKALIGLLLGGFLTFLLIFLEPFNTNEYISDNKTLMLSGYGVLLFVSIYLQGFIENMCYYRINKIWKVSHEIISTIIFFLIVGTILFLYNHLVINNLSYSLKSHLRYYKYIVPVFIPILFPPLLYFRTKFGELRSPIPQSKIVITGENKNERLEIEKKDLLYINAIENYIEIFFFDKEKKVISRTFRQTISDAHHQTSYLQKCHRSYLVNMNNVKGVKGNSQKAKIFFHNTKNEIPLSKTFYKNIKNNLYITHV